MYQFHQEAMEFYRSRYGLNYPLPHCEDWQQVFIGLKNKLCTARPDFPRPDGARIDITRFTL